MVHTCSTPIPSKTPNRFHPIQAALPSTSSSMDAKLMRVHGQDEIRLSCVALNMTTAPSRASAK
jgi:hypothetical protein